MIIWDNHTCLPLRPDDDRFLPQLQRARKAGVTAVGVNVGFGHQGIEEHVRMLAHFRRWIGERPEEYAMIRVADDVLRTEQTGRLGVFFDIEGAGAIADQVSLIGLYYDLGVRWMSIAYNLNNRVGGGCMDDDDGLTPFGERAIDEMASVGMIACCSHAGKRTSMEVIERSPNPVIFSHSNPRALCDHPRNIDDDVILECAAKGGVIGINGVGIFLGDDQARSETIARNIDYVARLAGIDHVALGLDYVYDTEELLEYLRSQPQLFRGGGGDVKSIAKFASPEQIPEILDWLRAMGYADNDVAKVMGLNLLRVAQAVWK